MIADEAGLGALGPASKLDASPAFLAGCSASAAARPSAGSPGTGPTSACVRRSTSSAPSSTGRRAVTERPRASFHNGRLPRPCGACLPMSEHPTIRIRGAHAQPEEHRSRPAAQPARRDHRPVGIGQVQPRLRHALCRGPAPLRREPVGLRAPVPAADGQARRRFDRGACRPPSASSRRRPRTTRAPRSAR